MDGFYLFLLYTALLAGSAFGVGDLYGQKQTADTCNDKGEVSLNRQVFSCERTHVLINGERIIANQGDKR